MPDFKGKDILDGAQFTRQDIDHVMRVAEDMRAQLKDRPGLDVLKGYVL